jgi:hypothetical protein
MRFAQNDEGVVEKLEAAAVNSRSPGFFDCALGSVEDEGTARRFAQNDGGWLKSLKRRR